MTLPILGPRLARRLIDTTSTGAMRLAVFGGGCNGMRYDFSVDPTPEPDDVRIDVDGATLWIDAVSLPFVAGATVEWIVQAAGGYVSVSNPLAASGCGCGQSFSPVE